MVYTRPLISKSSSPCTKPLMTVPSAPITIGITVTFMFHSFFSPLARSRYLSLFFAFFQWSAGMAKSTFRLVLFFFSFFFFFCWLSLGLVVWSRLGDPFVSQNSRGVCVFNFLDGFCVVHMPLVRMVKFKLLAQFPVDHLPHPFVSNLILFFANLLHSLIIWLIVLSWSPHNLLCCVLSIFALTSSSCHATGTDIPDPLSPLLPIVHRLWQVFRATSRILT